MSAKFALSFAALCLVLACAQCEARHLNYRRTSVGDSDLSIASIAGRRPHPELQRSVSPKQQGRVFPGALAIKKLVLLKFKKIIPISLILLKSSDENEAELVPVYPTSEIPANVQFIPTPNGISGHKDVQAIAIPTELHQQLEANGLANIENIEALLNDAEEEASSVGGESNTVAIEPVVHKIEASSEEELLNKKDDDEDQLLEALTKEKPTKIATASVSGLRRLATEEIARPGLRNSQRTTIEEIPLFLYSAKDAPQVAYNNVRKPSTRRRNVVARRHYA